MAISATGPLDCIRCKQTVLLRVHQSATFQPIMAWRESSSMPNCSHLPQQQAATNCTYNNGTGAQLGCMQHVA